MIIQCQGCAAKYFLPEDKTPPDPIRVRCPKCQAVFTLVPKHEAVPVGVAVESPALSESPASVAAEAMPRLDVATPAEEALPEAAPRKKRKGKPTKEDRAKRLARVLVSDILWYNRDKRDQALQEGTLMSALSDEIKKSWELYKDKVGSEVADSTNFFKEALNEILADGQEIF